MPALDTSRFLEAVSEASPAGPNLEFDPDFGALERAAQGKPEQQYGNTIIAAEPPDWPAVAAQATDLLARTRDLRVLAHLAVAQLHLEGIAAYGEVLALIHQLLASRWEDIHPQLDPEEGNDPTPRANALLWLAHPGLVLKHLRGLPLASSARLGQYSWRDVAIATGAIDAGTAGEKPSESLIRSAFQDSDPARLQALRVAAAAAAKSATAIVAVFDARAGHGSSPDLEDLVKLLGDLAHTIERYAPAEPAGEAASPSTSGTAADAGDAGAPAGPLLTRRQGVTVAALTEVTTRADALRLLDLACRYYQRYEPSSPLPLMIERALRLADKNFIEILRDLAPDGVMQAQTVVGARDE